MRDPEHIVDLLKLKAHRLARGVSLAELERRFGMAHHYMGLYEKGIKPMPLWVFRKICQEFTLDPLEIMELLKVKPIPLNLIIRFRVACRREGTTPRQALMDFLRVYVSED